MNLDMNAPSAWAPGLTNRQAIVLADLREEHGRRGLSPREDAKRWALEAQIGRALHGAALEENEDRDLLAQCGAVVVVDSAELAQLREQVRLSVLLVTEIYDRRRKRWHKAPMRQVETLAAALLQGRA